MVIKESVELLSYGTANPQRLRRNGIYEVGLMHGLNNNSFLALWQAVYATSNPDHNKDRWEVDDVEWARERHSFTGADYAMQLEVHRLVHGRGQNAVWQLLVVMEHWWSADRSKSLRDNYWVRPVNGLPDQILAWFKQRNPEGMYAPASDESGPNDEAASR